MIKEIGVEVKNKEVEKDEDLQTQQHKQGIQLQSYGGEFGRFGYIQVEGGQYYWEIYMDVLGRRTAEENYDHTKLKARRNKDIRVNILTTQQWPYPGGEPMIWQHNAFKIPLKYMRKQVVVIFAQLIRHRMVIMAIAAYMYCYGYQGLGL